MPDTIHIIGHLAQSDINLNFNPANITIVVKDYNANKVLATTQTNQSGDFALSLQNKQGRIFNFYYLRNGKDTTLLSTFPTLQNDTTVLTFYIQ